MSAVASMATVAIAGCALPQGEVTKVTLFQWSIFSTVKVGDDGELPPVEWLDVGRAARTADDDRGLEVLTHPTDRAIARETVALLAEMRPLLTKLLGVDPPPFGMFLRTGFSPERAHRLSVKVIEEHRLLFPMPVRGITLYPDDRLTVTRTMSHEWVETMIVDRLGCEGSESMYSRHRNTRWVGDGIAELVGFLVARELASPGLLEASQDLRIRSVGADARLAPLDAWLAFRGDYTRIVSLDLRMYLQAFAVWWLAWERSGPGVVTDFLERFVAVAPEDRTSAKCAAILAELTGLDVPELLSGMDRAQVLGAARRARATIPTHGNARR